MENASKALIIAGAILLAILIIGLGMLIFNQAKNAISGTGLDSTKVSTYNSEFEQYKGRQSGSNTKQLVRAIISHNRTNYDDPSMQIEFNSVVGNGTLTVPTNPYEATANQKSGIEAIRESNILSGGTYEIGFQYSKAGYITKCYINKITQ